MLWSGRRVLVLGAGVSGQAAAKLLRHFGAEVILCDQKPREGVLSEEEAPNDVDFMVVSPGIPDNHPLLKRMQGISQIGETELAFRTLEMMEGAPKIVGITGTNGKTTVTLWTAHTLERLGISAKAVGNVGHALCDALLEPLPEVFVLELSSYQLDRMQTKLLDAGAILNISEDHLDRYGSMEAYTESKWQIAKLLKPKASLIVQKRFSRGMECERLVDESLESLSALGYRGDLGPNAENRAFVYALCHLIGAHPDCHALEEFKRPPHRLEFVATKDGVDFVNDSKATNVDAVLRAVEMVKAPIVLIAGGRDKGGSYSAWIPAFDGRVKGIVAIGEAAGKIKAALPIEVRLAESLELAVKMAKGWAKKGETVLLSPGCSSFDQFRDYAERGDAFCKCVEAT